MSTVTVRNGGETMFVLAGRMLYPGEVRTGINRAVAVAVQAEQAGLVIYPSLALPEAGGEENLLPEGEGTEAKADDLTRLSGVGAAKARKLAEAGFDSFARLADAEPAEMAAAVSGLSEEQAEALIAEAVEFFIS